jgi:hypothetical protein
MTTVMTAEKGEHQSDNADEDRRKRESLSRDPSIPSPSRNTPRRAPRSKSIQDGRGAENYITTVMTAEKGEHQSNNADEDRRKRESLSGDPSIPSPSLNTPRRAPRSKSIQDGRGAAAAARQTPGIRSNSTGDMLDGRMGEEKESYKDPKPRQPEALHEAHDNFPEGGQRKGESGKRQSARRPVQIRSQLGYASPFAGCEIRETEGMSDVTRCVFVGRR